MKQKAGTPVPAFFFNQQFVLKITFTFSVRTGRESPGVMTRHSGAMGLSRGTTTRIHPLILATDLHRIFTGKKVFVAVEDTICRWI
jgi:hypothetical protein